MHSLTKRVHQTKSDKKNQKRWRAAKLLASAVIWAEMAADHENSQNSKKKISAAHGHHVASWLSDQPYNSTNKLNETAEKSLFLL